MAWEFQLYAAISCDQLWWARNKARVEGINSNPTELARQILRVFQEHKQAWKVQSVRKKKDVSWSPPPPNWIKMNFDAACREEKTTIAVVSRDSMGNTLKAWSDHFISSSPLVGEARAAWSAMMLVVNEGYENIILEGDVWNVIKPIRNADVDPHWSIKALCDDILYFVKFFNNVKFSFVCREGNVSTHLLAQWAALVNWTGPVSISYLPSSIFGLRIEMEFGPVLLFLPLFGLSNKVLIQQKKEY